MEGAGLVSGGAICNVNYCTYVACLPYVDPHPRQWISVCTMPFAQGCWHVIISAPYMSVHEDNTTPISNDSIARLGPKMRL